METVKSAFEVYQKQQIKKKRKLSLDPEQPENVTKKNKLDKKQQIVKKNADLKSTHKADLKQRKKEKIDKPTNGNAHANGVANTDKKKKDKKKNAFPFLPGPITTKFKKESSEDSSDESNYIDKHKTHLIAISSILLNKDKVKEKSGKNSTSSKSEKVSKKVENGDISSEEEIPTLVPIKRPKNKPETKLFSSLSNKEKTNNVESEKKSKPFNPLTYSLGVFKWLIDPISPKELFDNYWEKEVLHIKRENEEYYQSVFSSERLDQILRENHLNFTRNIDVVTYTNGKKEVMNEEGKASPALLWDYYNNGCSIRVLNPQSYDENIHSIISNLQEYFGSMVGTNVYLTPPNSQGFAPHYDDIEAFIIQLEGSKYWKLYKPKPQEVLARDSSPNFEQNELDKPFMEVKLNAGDLLYFPRGTIHEGCTKDEHSLHITVSVYQHTAYIDLLEKILPTALATAAKENIEFRKGLPLNYLKYLGAVNKKDDSDNRKLIIDKVKSLFNSVVDYLDVDSGADLLGRTLIYDSMPPVYSNEEAENSSKRDGDYMKNGRVYNRVEIGPEAKIRLLRYYALRVVSDSSGSKIYFCTDNAKTYHGEDEQWLEIDDSLIPGLEMLQKQYPEFVQVDQLPISDETNKLHLVASLWERGLIVTDGPLPTCDSDSDDDSEDVISVESD